MTASSSIDSTVDLGSVGLQLPTSVHRGLCENRGNMLSAVGPFAIEAGLGPVHGVRTTARVHNVNTGKIIEAVIEIPGGAPRYPGAAAIDGVPGPAAPVCLAFTEDAGAKTGRLPPAGTPRGR